MLNETLRNISIATVAMPLALANVSGGRTDEEKAWRAKAVATMQTADVFLQGQLRIVPLSHPGLAQTSLDDLAQSTFENPKHATTALAKSVAYEAPSELDWVTNSLAQLGEMLGLPPDELPNEQPLEHSAIGASAGVIVDLQHAEAPPVHVAPRGDGGLQLLWYTPSRDLEIEIAPTGKISLIEFDGKTTKRAPYSALEALKAIQRLKDAA